MSLRLELCDFTPEPVDLQLLGLHLTVPRKRLLRICAKFLHPFANNVLVDVEVPRRLSHAYASLTHQAYRLDLDSRLNLRLCIACLRLPETPYLGVHGTGSRPQEAIYLGNRPLSTNKTSSGEARPRGQG